MVQPKKIATETNTSKTITFKLASYKANLETYNGGFDHLTIENVTSDQSFYFSTLPGAKRFIDLIDGIHDTLKELQKESKGVIP